MSDLIAFSNAVAALTAEAGRRTIAVRNANGTTVSGFIWRTGLAVTAHEALEADDEVEAVTATGTLTGTIAGRDPSTDVALIKLDTGDFPEWTAAPTPAAGSLAVLVGRTEGSILSSLASLTETGPAWRSMRGGEIDARLTLGIRLSSRAEGGAVVAPDGTLIGMAVNGARRRTLAIPASTVARAVATLSEKGYVPRGWLGVSLHPVGQGGGAIIVGLEPESPAAKGGFLVGDIITTWSDQPVGSVGEVAERLVGGTVGQTAKLGVLRGGNALELDVIIGERPRG